EVFETADTKNRNQIAQPNITDLDRFKGDNASTNQQCGLKRVHAHEDLGGEGGLGKEVLGVAAVDGVTGVALGEAERLPAGEAVLAGAACVTQPRDRDQV